MLWQSSLTDSIVMQCCQQSFSHHSLLCHPPAKLYLGPSPCYCPGPGASSFDAVLCLAHLFCSSKLCLADDSVRYGVDQYVASKHADGVLTCFVERLKQRRRIQWYKQHATKLHNRKVTEQDIILGVMHDARAALLV